MTNPKPPASRPPKDLRDREIPDEYLIEIGKEITRQLEKAKPPPESRIRKEAPMAWAMERKSNPFDEDAETKQFVRLAPSNTTECVGLPTSEAEQGKPLWERFKRLIDRLF